ncbi:hypothetical protein GCM10009555_014210 [Acrocarpospora macrocephala]|uniref:DUF559 domain-containing protein n=1 Tax=Acrocarpospora macrocephala TaxID=150177 RepID=A0A5M3WJ71_9ACTN|nr:hypothetical protein [Acrocarpospora macrocephala]GES08229.1 hypothetical protein Amac_018240 [Acrocarpospora macrocephala]
MHFHGTNALLLCKAQLILLLDGADRRLCADQDRWAYELEWTITRAGFGARQYRDPRFDLVQEVEEAGRMALMS